MTKAWLRLVLQPETTIALLIMATLMALSRTPTRGGGPSFASLAGPLRLALLVALILHAAIALRRNPRSRRVLWLLAPYAAAVVLSILGSPLPLPEAPEAAPYLLSIAGLLVLGLHIGRSEEAAVRLVRALAAVYGLVAVLNVALVPLMTQPGFSRAADATGVGRFQGILENPNSLGALGFAGLPLLVAAAVLNRGSKLRLAVSVTAAVLLALEVLASASRGGLAGTVGALSALLLLAAPLRLRVRVALLGVAVGAVCLLTLALTPVSSALRFGALLEAGGRTNVWPLVVHVIGERPVLGSGFGSSRTVFASFGPVPGFHGAFSGNLMLDLLLEVGILGTVAFLAIVVVALVRAALSWRGSTTPRQRLVLATWVSVLVGGLLNAQAESVLSRVGGVGNLIFWLAVAICGAEDASSTTARVPRLAALAGRL